MNLEYKAKVDKFNSNYYVNYLHLDITDMPEYQEIPVAALTQVSHIDWDLLYRESVFENQDEKLREVIFYHEYGHAFFAHHLLARKGYTTLLEKIKEEGYIERMAKVCNRPVIYIKALLASPDFLFRLLNIAADCEINSKILTYDDVEMIDKALGADSIHPRKFGFLEERTYLEYVPWVAEYLNLFIPPKQQDQQGSGDGEGQEGEGDGQGDGSGGSGEVKLGKGPAGGAGSNFITPELIEKMVDDGIIDEEGNLTEKGKQELEEIRNSGGEGSESGEGQEGSSGGQGQPDSRFQGRGDSGGSVLRDNTKNILKSMDELFRDLRNKEVLKMTTTRNLFKNQLRGRSGNMYVPSLKMNPAKVKVEQMTFLVDVSGSMDERSIFGIVNDIAIRVKKIGLERVRLITWNTGFVQDLMIRDFQPKKGMLRIGGGTDLAKGLKYIRELDEGVPIVVISDLQDSMRDWNREFDLIKVPKYVVTLGDVNQRDVKAINEDVKIFESDYE